MNPFNLFQNKLDFVLFEPDQVIFQEGQIGDQMFLILDGELQISVEGHPIDLLSVGDIWAKWR